MMTDEPLSYADFRTGLDFGTVREILWHERRAEYASTGQYKGVPRLRQVKGKWHAIKVAMYESYLRDFRSYEQVERRALQDRD